MKNKVLFLSLILAIGVSGCTPAFDPFDFDSLDIISNEQAIYISNEATDNLSSVTSLTHSISSVDDNRSVFNGSAYYYGSFTNESYNEEITIYSNSGLTSTSTTITESGNNYAGSSYYEVTNSTDIWMGYDSEEEVSYTYYVNEFSNPNTEDESIQSSYRTVVNETDNYQIEWNMLVVDMVSDGYTYSSFDHYGASNGDIYAYSENVTQSSIPNPLHSDETIITYSQTMSVRSFTRDSNLGWVINYSAYQESLYYATTIDGNVYDSPVLVSEYQESYQYGYENNGSKSFSFIESVETYYYQPRVLVAYYIDDNLYYYSSSLSGYGYLLNYSSSSLTYYSATITLRKGYYYACYMSGDEEYTLYGAETITRDDYDVFTFTSIELSEDVSCNFVSVDYDLRVNLIFGFNADGEIVSIDVFYLNRVGGWE
ncbi:MAG: hypothetical protein LUB56_00525 [Coprobacillus sp.]|nr:hypothetical protein [Coprobacillus sp.]